MWLSSAIALFGMRSTNVRGQSIRFGGTTKDNIELKIDTLDCPNGYIRINGSGWEDN